MARYTGADCRRCCRGEDEAVPQGQQVRRAEVPVRVASLPARRSTAVGAPKETEYLLQLREKQKARRVYGVLEQQFQAATTTRRSASRARPVRSCSRSCESQAGQRGLPGRLRQVPRHGPAAGQARPLRGQRQEGRYPVVPGSSEHDIIEVRGGNRQLTPFVVAARRGRLPDGSGLAGGHPQPDEDPRAHAPGPRRSSTRRSRSS